MAGTRRVAPLSYCIYFEVRGKPESSAYPCILQAIGALRAPYFSIGLRQAKMVSTEIVAFLFMTVSNGRIAAFVPDSLERYWKRGRRKMRCGRRDASATSIYSFCCCRRSRRNRWLRQQIRTENLGNNDSTFFVHDGSPGVE